MRCLQKNKSKLYYATYAGEAPVYDRDESGEIKYVESEGEKIPVVLAEQPSYGKPTAFFANIAMSGGEAEAREYGVNTADYEAVLLTSERTLPIDENTLVWHNSVPEKNEDGTAIADSADYRVLMVKPSLNSTKYLLKRLQKGGRV